MANFFNNKEDKFTVIEKMEENGYELLSFEIKKVRRATAREEGLTLKKEEYMDNPMIVWELYCEEENETYTVRQMLFISKSKKDGEEYLSSPLSAGYQRKDGTFATKSTAYEIYEAIVNGDDELKSELLKLGWQDDAFWLNRKFQFLAKTGVSRALEPYCILATEYQINKDKAYQDRKDNDAFDLDKIAKDMEGKKEVKDQKAMDAFADDAENKKEVAKDDDLPF